MSRHGKVIVAMSGGVDSSVAACLLRQQGYDCVGVFMRVGIEGTEARRHEGTKEATKPRGHDTEGAEARVVPTSPRSHVPASPPRRLKHGCCSVADAVDARVIAGKLGIPFYALNFQADFERIIAYFVDEYARARTPNPCVVCNTELKFGKLLRYADMMDAEFVATGHYARVVRGDVGTWGGGDGIESGRPTIEVARGQCFLTRSLNLAKDQTYVLFGIARENLRRCLFPLGDISEKAEVRRMAADLGLVVHDKPESQEICFVPDNDYKRLVRERRPETQRPGEIRDAAGRVLGTHEGIVNYTVGQRRGLGIPAGEPIYVTRLDVLSNTVTVGSRDDILANGLRAGHVNWLTDAPAVGEWQPAEIKIRHRHTSAAGKIRLLAAGDVEVRFEEPQAAVTPGQAAVFYREDGVVLGGGWIRTAADDP